MPPVIRNQNPNKTLFFRFQKSFREVGSGKVLYTLAEAWPIIYKELKLLDSVYPWAVSIYAGPYDIKTHGSYGIIFTIRFIKDKQYLDTILKFTSNDIYEDYSFTKSSSDCKNLFIWAKEVSSNVFLRKYANSILFKKALHYNL